MYWELNIYILWIFMDLVPLSWSPTLFQADRFYQILPDGRRAEDEIRGHPNIKYTQWPCLDNMSNDNLQKESI